VKKLFFLSSFIFLMACDSQQPEIQKPEPLLSKQEMVDFLLDVQLLEGQVKELRISLDSSQKVYNYFEKELYQKHGFSDSVYVQSYHYYVEKPELLKEIYDTVYDSLERKQEAFKQEKK
jgi:hypothetical protein